MFSKTKKLKKGFTLVELVVVIAIIAILSGVSIAVYTGITDKAKTAADSEIISQLNTQMKAKKVLEGKNKNCSEAYADAFEVGFDLNSLKPSSGGNYVWDQEKDLFAHIKGDDLISGDKDYALPSEHYKLWKFTAEISSAEECSQYLTSATYAEDVTVKAGVDLGENELVENVFYTNSETAKNVIIRTNNEDAKVVVNAPADTVKHYGVAKSVEIQAVSSTSYYEYGTVKLADIKNGRLVIANAEEASVGTVYLTATNDAYDDIIIATMNGAELPTVLQRDAVTVTDGKVICTIQTNVSDEGKNPEKTEVITIKGTNNVQEATNGYSNVSEMAQLVLEAPAGTTGAGAEYIGNDTSVAEGDKEATLEAATLFAGGKGTKDNPWLIDSYDTFQRISTMSWTKYAYDSYYGEEHYKDWTYACEYANSFTTVSDAYYKVKDGVKEIDCSNWTPVYLDGNFDGNGVTLNNLDAGLFDTVDGTSSVIKNFTINANISTGSGVAAVIYNGDCLDITIDSVNVHGTIIGKSWVTSFIEFGPGPSYAWNVTIKNSISDAKIVAAAGSASGFIGHPYDDVSNGSRSGSSLITIIDSAYIGNMSATGSSTESNYNFKYFTINGNDNKIKTSYSQDFINKLGFNPEGTLYASLTTKSVDSLGTYPIVDSDGSKTFFCGNYGQNVYDFYRPGDTSGKKAILDTTNYATLPENKGEVISIKKVSGATKAIVSLVISPNDSNNFGSYTGTYLSEEIDITSIDTNATFTSKNIKYFNIGINSGATTFTGISSDGKTFNVVDKAYGKNAHNGAYIEIVQYDANGNVLNISSVTIAAKNLAE